MKPKQVILGAVTVVALVLAWWLLGKYVDYKYPGWREQQAQQKQPAPPATNTVPPADIPTTGTTTAPATTAAAPATTTTAPATTTAPSRGLRVAAYDGPAGGESAELGSSEHKHPTYAMEVTLKATGAGIEEVVLNDFFKTVEKKDAYSFQQPYPINPNGTRPLASRSVTVEGGGLGAPQTVDLSGVTWTLERGPSTAPATAPSAAASSATYSVTLVDGDRPVVRVFKTFELPTRADPTKGYELLVRYGFQNLTDAAMKVSTAFNGTVTPPPEAVRGPDRQVVCGYKSGDQGIVIEHHLVDEFEEDEPSKELTQNEDKQPLVWAGAGSIYFDAIVFPADPADRNQVAGYVQKLRAEALNPAAEPKDRNVAMTFETAPLALAPAGKVGAEQALPLNVYLGPKWRKVVDYGPFAEYPRYYSQALVIKSGPCSMCTFDPLINGLVWMLGKFQWLWGGFAGKGDWGLAIITLVVIVRTLLHPITKRAQVHMMKMGKLGPEMERLKKKYGEDNKEELQKAMFSLYKQQGMTPILGCLPMFLQMPIWIALYAALQTTFELRHEPFLWGWTWIDDLSQPDRLVYFPNHAWDLYFFKVDAINLLPLLLSVVFYLQQKFTPKPPALTPEQQQQQKMMVWMSVALFPLFLYTGPSGLNLYILTSTTIGIIESKRIRDHIKQREEAEKAGKVIVDARPTRAGKSGKKGSLTEQPEPKRRGLMSMLGDLQERLEQIRREAQRKGK